MVNHIWNISVQLYTVHTHVRGIVVLGLEASPDDLAASFALARKHELVKGFAVGRTIFVHAAREWFAGRMTDADAIEDMTTRYAALCVAWDAAQGTPA